MTLNEAIKLFLTARTGEIAPATVTWYETNLRALAAALGDRELEAISLDDLRAWRLTVVTRSSCYDSHPYRPPEVSHGLSRSTQHNRVMACRILFEWLMAENHISVNPAARLVVPTIPRKQEPKAVLDEDIRALHTAAVEHGLDREHALVHCLAETGARVAGIANLRLSDVDLVKGELVVTEKGNKARQVYLLDDGCAALRTWLQVRPEVDHNFVFTGRSGAQLTTTGIYQALRRLADLAGVDRANPHGFRHAFARGMLNAGLSLEAVSDLMGHSSIVVTAESYAVWTKSELRVKHKAAGKRRGLWNE